MPIVSTVRRELSQSSKMTNPTPRICSRTSVKLKITNLFEYRPSIARVSFHYRSSITRVSLLQDKCWYFRIVHIFFIYLHTYLHCKYLYNCKKLEICFRFSDKNLVPLTIHIFSCRNNFVAHNLLVISK